MYDLFVTHFSNKTWNESVRYNKKIRKSEYELKEECIINKWLKFTIPSMEKKVKKYRKMMFKTDDINVKKELKKEKVKIQNDIKLLKDYINDYYELNTSRITDDMIMAESKELCQNWIYNCPTMIHDSVTIGNELYLFEMNNDMNKITGITLLKNVVEKKIYNKIHESMNYNRYSYYGKRLDRKDITDKDNLKKIESILFCGSKHQKRGQGIQKVGEESRKKINELIWDIKCI